MTKSTTLTWLQFRKMNKVAREKKAIALGFKNSDELANSIKNPNVVGKTVPPKKVAVKKATVKSKVKQVIIHVVDVLDASGSMNGSKFLNAVKGIKEGVEKLKGDTEAIYYHSLCVFSTLVNFEHLNLAIDQVKIPNLRCMSSTALYDAIGETFKQVKPNPSDISDAEVRVLVNIYTDGDENCSKKFTKSQVSKLIEEHKSKGWVVTFIGTKHDVNYVIANLNIDCSNTLEYNNTGEGLKQALDITFESRSSFTKDLKAGKDVSTGFYKNIVKK